MKPKKEKREYEKVYMKKYRQTEKYKARQRKRRSNIPGYYKERYWRRKGKPKDMSVEEFKHYENI